MKRSVIPDKKKHGKTYTPKEVSKFLVNWAVRNPTDTVLEPSVGEGRFVFDTFDRLCSLGASVDEACNQVYGIDIDQNSITHLQTKATEQIGKKFPNIQVKNIFDADLPKVDALVGNPPYVIRHRFENAETIIEQYSEDYDYSKQSDLYVYFLTRASEFLAPGGKFAMIVSNSWMKRKYGEEFKKFLLNNFKIHGLIGFQERVFGDLVNSVCILAEKRENTIRLPANHCTHFIQADNSNIFNGSQEWTLDELTDEAVNSAQVNQDELSPDDYWDIWLRAPDVFETIGESPYFVPLSNFANLMIGVQTLAKDFYIISNEENSSLDIEEEYLRPIAYSPNEFEGPVITSKECTKWIFWCSNPINDLTGTNAHEYIKEAEDRTVSKRYSDEVYEGVHNKTRIKKANREPWYNITEEANRRLPSDILLPRRVYKTYKAVWNKDNIIPNENFISVNPKNIDLLKPLLAYLNSDIGELNLRLAGQVYGGGVCDLNVSSASEIATINFDEISKSELSSLSEGFDEFVKTGKKSFIDNAVYDALDYGIIEKQEIEEALELVIYESLKKSD